MALPQGRAEYGAAAEAVLQPVNHRRHAFAAGRGHVELGLLRNQRLGGQRIEDQGFDAETRRHRVQLFGEQALQMAHVAARLAGADAKELRRAVEPVAAELELPRAPMLPLQRQAQRGQKLSQRAIDILAIADTVGKGQPHPPLRGRPARADRLLLNPAHTIKTLQDGRAEAPVQRPTRQVEKMAEGAQAKTPQLLRHIRRQPQRGNGQRTQCRQRCAGLQNRPLAMPRPGPGG